MNARQGWFFCVASSNRTVHPLARYNGLPDHHARSVRIAVEQRQVRRAPERKPAQLRHIQHHSRADRDRAYCFRQRHIRIANRIRNANLQRRSGSGQYRRIRYRMQAPVRRQLDFASDEYLPGAMPPNMTASLTSTALFRFARSIVFSTGGARWWPSGIKVAHNRSSASWCQI